ncbi:hypothetical protein BDQ17DRAFT_1433280 [Cyathus striatus]|nr:hypothetical protein BDQ17DRAFT_1433280 [Cyathus striatus]
MSTLQPRDPPDIHSPKLISYLRKVHPADWPSNGIRELFHIPIQLPEDTELRLGVVPPHPVPVPNSRVEGPRKALEEALVEYPASPRKSFWPLVAYFIDWLDAVRWPYSHMVIGMSVNMFGKVHIFDTKLTIAHCVFPFMTLITEETRAASRSILLEGKLEGRREKEAEYGVCGHNFAVLLGMAQMQRKRKVLRELYKVHIVYPSTATPQVERAIIVTAHIPAALIDGLCQDPPELYLDGLKFSRGTVKVPGPNDTIQDCELFKALMFIIDEQFEELDAFLPDEYKAGDKFKVYTYT